MGHPTKDITNDKTIASQFEVFLFWALPSWSDLWIHGFDGRHATRTRGIQLTAGCFIDVILLICANIYTYVIYVNIDYTHYTTGINIETFLFIEWSIVFWLGHRRNKQRTIKLKLISFVHGFFLPPVCESCWCKAWKSNEKLKEAVTRDASQCELHNWFPGCFGRSNQHGPTSNSFKRSHEAARWLPSWWFPGLRHSASSPIVLRPLLLWFQAIPSNSKQ